jgi:hypothetical protein
MSKRRNWLWIIFGVCVVLVFIGIGAIVATTAWVQQNLTVTEATEDNAQQEFDSVRSRYAGRPPLLELRNGKPVYTGGAAPASQGSATPLEHLHVLVWDPDEGKLASFSIPFWLLRLKTGPIEFSSYASGMDDEGVHVSPQDIEKHGPGIILDTTSPKGERILLWAQ